MWTRTACSPRRSSSRKEHLALAEPQAVVINSGIANAATGERGEADARATADRAAELLGLEPEQVIVLSTGVIGAPLPLDASLAGVDAAAAALSADGGDDAAEAILTTDTQAKTAVAHGDGFWVGGMAKGSGMIHPNLATMLAVVTTDYPLEPGEAIEFLRPAVDVSFNAISVDGECSTNDAVVLLASGARGGRAHARDRRGVRGRAARRCAATSRSRSSPTARARRCRRDQRPRRDERAEASAIASASRPRRSSRPRSSAATPTGAAC